MFRSNWIGRVSRGEEGGTEAESYIYGFARKTDASRIATPLSNTCSIRGNTEVSPMRYTFLSSFERLGISPPSIRVYSNRSICE